MYGDSHSPVAKQGSREVSREEIVDIMNFCLVCVKETMCLGELRWFRFYQQFKLDPVMD